nr:histone-lysine N-methyltransferase ATX4 isoform X2 [Tanacetum cinerariifolium]
MTSYTSKGISLALPWGRTIRLCRESLGQGPHETQILYYHAFAMTLASPRLFFSLVTRPDANIAFVLRPKENVLPWLGLGQCPFPAWPAIVIDPICEAPKAVLMACVPNTLCVMFYGFSRKGERDYAWVKDGMVFPFKEYLESFPEQTQLYGSKPEDFRMAIEEARLAENESLNPVDVVKEECSSTSEFVEVPVAATSDQDLEFFRRKQSAYNNKDKQTCDSCVLSFHSDTMKKAKGITSQQNAFCEHCS